jgi:hypothetical protein
MRRHRPSLSSTPSLDSVALVFHALGDITRHGESTTIQLGVIDIALLVSNFKCTSTRATLSVAFHFRARESFLDFLLHALEAGPVTSGSAVFDVDFAHDLA